MAKMIGPVSTAARETESRLVAASRVMALHELHLGAEIWLLVSLP